MRGRGSDAVGDPGVEAGRLGVHLGVDDQRPVGGAPVEPGAGARDRVGVGDGVEQDPVGRVGGEPDGAWPTRADEQLGPRLGRPLERDVVQLHVGAAHVDAPTVEQVAHRVGVLTQQCHGGGDRAADLLHPRGDAVPDGGAHPAGEQALWGRNTTPTLMVLGAYAHTVGMSLVLVTGASTGLGLATVTALLDAGHDVVLHARSADRVEDPAVLERVAGTAYADLSDLDATVALAHELDGFGRFDAVVHNAGTMDRGLATSVNVVAPYVLTALMSPPARSIVLSSGMHLSGSTDLVGGGSYSDTKLWVTTLVMAWAEHRPDTLWHAVDPGWVATRMGGAGAPDDLVEGHRTQVWLATAPEADIVPRTGGYWHHHEARDPHRATRDANFQRAVLNHLAERTGIRPD